MATSQQLTGDACAYIKGENGEKNRYLKMGTAILRSDNSLSLKLDTIPLGNSGWQGWVNVFWKDAQGQNIARPPAARPVAPAYAHVGGKTGFDDMDDDIPF